MKRHPQNVNLEKFTVRPAGCFTRLDDYYSLRVFDGAATYYQILSSLGSSSCFYSDCNYA
jgi:hypothetical protein